MAEATPSKFDQQNKQHESIVLKLDELDTSNEYAKIYVCL